MFIKIDGLFYIRILLHTALFRERAPRTFFHSFHTDKDAMNYALSLVQFLLNPDLHRLIHAGKQWLTPDLKNA